MIKAENPLAHLKALHLPEPVSSWPLAPGWWILLLLLILGAFWLIKTVVAYIRKNAYRRVAHQQLQLIYRQYLVEKSDRQLLHSLNKLLKSTAINQYSDQYCSPLYGSDWAVFLGSCVKASRQLDWQIFLLLEQSYARQVSVSEQQRSALYQATKLWIFKHTVPLKSVGEAVQCNAAVPENATKTQESKVV